MAARSRAAPCADTSEVASSTGSSPGDTDDAGCLGKGSGLVVSATYLTAAFGGAPAYYSLRLGQPCSSAVVVHLLFILDSFRSMRVSSDRICFTPENYSEPQLVRVEVLDAHSHSNAISHRVYSLDKNYDRISTPSVVVKTEWTGVGSLLTFGGPMSKRRAAAVGSALTPVDIHRAIPTLPVLSTSHNSTTSSSNGLSGPPLGSSSEDQQQQLQDPPWFVCQLASGHNFSLAVVVHQTTMLITWGVNANGELGLGSTTWLPEPQLVTALPMQVNGELIGVLSVSCGKHHAALVTTQAKLFTWGSNKYGQLGHSDYTNRLAPQEVHFALATLSSNQRALRIKHTILERGGTNVTHAACGAAHTLFVTHQQNILAMGYNQAGQLGIGHRLQQHKSWRSCVPIAVDALRDRSILDVAAGQNHSACVLSNGAVYVWGCGDDGRLGVGRRECAMTPVLVPSLSDSGVRARNVRCGARHTAIISDHDVLYMWGANEFGQLGCGDKKPRYKPCVLHTPALIADGVADVALGEFHSVCVTHNGKAFAWGLDLSGESAQIDQRSSPTVLPLPKGQRAQRVSCGWGHTNIVTHPSSSYDDSTADELRTPMSPSASTATLYSPSSSSSPSPTSTSFHRAIERKELALRRAELAKWRAFAAPWGLPVPERPPVLWKLGKSEARRASAMAGLNQSKRTAPFTTNESFKDAERTIATAAPLTPVDGVRTAMRQRLAAAFVKQIIGRCLQKVALTRDTNVITERARSALSPTTTRGIFYQNALQPPALPPSSTIALRSLAASYHHRQRQQHTDYCKQDSQGLSDNAESVRAASPTALCPTRPQSCTRSRPHAPPWSPRGHRPVTIGSSAVRDDASSLLHHSPAPDASPVLVSPVSSPQTSHVPPQGKVDERRTRATQLKQSCCSTLCSPRGPAKRAPLLGVMETLMHKPSYSIAQAVLVAPSMRSSPQRSQQQRCHSSQNIEMPTTT